jgi:hypothetical protein
MTDYYIDQDLTTGADDGSSPANAWRGTGNGGKEAIDKANAVLNGTSFPGANIIFKTGGSPYRCQVEPSQNGADGNPAIWRSDAVGQKVVFTCFDDANDINIASGDAYQWNLSGGGTNEYYLTVGDAITPIPTEVKCGVVDGYYMGSSSDDDRTPRGHRLGTVGALLNQQIGWGNSDGLAANTLYCRFDDNTPANHTVEINQRSHVQDIGFNYHEWEDIIFEGGDPICVKPRTGWRYRRCCFRWPDFTAANLLGGINTSYFISCLFYFPGHRAGESSSTGSFRAYNCTEVYGHIFARNGAADGTIELRNCISAEEEAGSIDNSAGGTLDEDYNCFFPYMNAAGGALSYPNGDANWTQTNINDIPPNHPGTETSQANLISPQFSNFNPDVFSVTGLRLLSTSPCVGAGADWWTAIGEPLPFDYEGVAIDAGNVHLGAFQTLVSAGAGTRTGKDGKINIGVNGLISARSWTIESTAEPIEDSVIGTQDRSYNAGLNGYTLNFEGYYNIEDLGQQGLNIGTLVAFGRDGRVYRHRSGYRPANRGCCLMANIPATADLSPFFQAGELSHTALLNGVTEFDAIYQDFYSEIIGGTVNLSSTDPGMIAQQSQVPDITEGRLPSVQIVGRCAKYSRIIPA